MSHYTHLTIEERESILRMRAEKKGIREIARELQRSASTISREICRNQERSGEYSPSKAEAAYHKRRQRCGRQRIFKVNLEAKRKVRHLFLDLHWSPEQISCRLRMEGNEVQVIQRSIVVSIHTTWRKQSYHTGAAGWCVFCDTTEKPGIRKGQKSVAERLPLVTRLKIVRMKRIPGKK